MPDKSRFLISAIRISRFNERPTIKGFCMVRPEVIRNTLVHGYMDVDRTIVYEVLQNGLCDIEELKRVFARHL